jgi:hypothetical protein
MLNRIQLKTFVFIFFENQTTCISPSSSPTHWSCSCCACGRHKRLPSVQFVSAFDNLVDAEEHMISHSSSSAAAGSSLSICHWGNWHLTLHVQRLIGGEEGCAEESLVCCCWCWQFILSAAALSSHYRSVMLPVQCRLAVQILILLFSSLIPCNSEILLSVYTCLNCRCCNACNTTLINPCGTFPLHLGVGECKRWLHAYASVFPCFL